MAVVTDAVSQHLNIEAGTERIGVTPSLILILKSVF